MEVRAASDDSDDDKDDDQERAAPETKRSVSKWKKTCSLATITTEDLRESVDEQYPELLGKSCYDLWTRFLTEETLEYILEQTKLFAGRDKNDPIGILIFSGYHFVSSEKDYWSNQPDLLVSFVALIISRDLCLKI